MPSLGANFTQLMQQAADALPPNAINESMVDEVAGQLDSLQGLMSLGEYVDPITGQIRRLHAGSMILNDQGLRVSGDGTLGVFTGAQTYNAESIEDGDIIIGSNATDQANIQWDKSAGLLNFRGGTTVGGYIGTDGSAIFGGGVIQLNSSGFYMENTFSIFVGDQTYNSESVYDGDLIMGENSANKANIQWDKSAGLLNFRGGTSIKGYIDSSGNAIFGAGDVVLNENGITINLGSSNPNYIKFDGDTTAGGNQSAAIIGVAKYGGSTRGLGLNFQLYGSTNEPSQMAFVVENSNGNNNQVYMGNNDIPLAINSVSPSSVVSSMIDQVQYRMSVNSSVLYASSGAGIRHYWQMEGGGGGLVNSADIQVAWENTTASESRIAFGIQTTGSGDTTERLRIGASSGAHNVVKSDVDFIFYGTTNAVLTIDALENLPQLTTQSKTSNASGAGGMFAVDGSYLYVHDSTEWRRVAISTF